MKKIIENILISFSFVKSVDSISLDILKPQDIDSIPNKNFRFAEEDFDNYTKDEPFKVYFKTNASSLTVLSLLLNGVPNELERKIILNNMEILKEAIVLNDKILFDELTGIGNTRKLKIDLSFELSRCKRDKAEISLIFIDIKGFKKINDTLGHETGNTILKRFSTCLIETLRDTDRVYRYGGDEFIILLNDIDENGIEAVIKKLKEYISESEKNK